MPAPLSAFLAGLSTSINAGRILEIIVGSKYLAVEINCALDASGREHLVVIAKSTWQIPEPGQRPRPLAPEAIEQSDIFAGDPENSPMLYGSDMARFKPRCDVIFDASAHTPDGLPAREVNVAWQVGPLRKGLKAHGPRHWTKRLGMVSLSEAEPVTSTPLHFGFALGGSRQYKKAFSRADVMLADSHPVNPAGMGWYGARASDEIDGAPAPRLEALDNPVRKPNGKQAPIAFSAIARHWSPRPQYGGTYDEQWQEEVFPFLPGDFDEQFNQCAPVDQQMAYPVGGEAIVLRNMMAGRPDVRFKLPKLDGVKVQILRHDYSAEAPEAVVDTLYFEPDQARFSVVWRTSAPINRRVQEFKTIAVGPVNTEWWHQQAAGGSGCGNCS